MVIPVGGFATVLAALGAVVSISSLRGWKRWTLASVFILLGVGEWIALVKRDNANTIQMAELRGRMNLMTDLLLHPPSSPQLDKMSAILDSIAESVKAKQSKSVVVQVPIPNGGSSLELRALTNGQLKQKTIELAKNMRDFERNAKSEEYSREVFRQFPANATEEQKRAIWQQGVNESLQRHINRETDFRNRFLVDARMYEAELLRRLNIPTPLDQPIAIKYGALAGPSPISDLADYLETFAKRLPI